MCWAGLVWWLGMVSEMGGVVFIAVVDVSAVGAVFVMGWVGLGWMG